MVFFEANGFASIGQAMVFYCWAHTGMGFLVLYLAFIVYILPWVSVFQMFWLVAINGIIVCPVYPYPTWYIIN